MSGGVPGNGSIRLPGSSMRGKACRSDQVYGCWDRRNNGTTLHGQTPGFLGKKHSSFAIDQYLLGEHVKVQAVQPNDDLSSLRLSARRDLLKQFDEQRKLIDQSAHAKNLDAFYQRAFNLVGSAETRKAFDLASESPKLRDRYGKTEFGQRCLLARRLAEAGVPMVNISYCHTPRGSWDTHSRNFQSMKETLGPTLDTALTALVNDLDERGMLDFALESRFQGYKRLETTQLDIDYWVGRDSHFCVSPLTESPRSG